MLEMVTAGTQPATAERHRGKLSGIRAWRREAQRVQWWAQEDTEMRAILWVDLCFLGLLQQGLDRPYGLALTLTSLHALRAAALTVAGFPFLLLLALGVLITEWFNIIIQSIRWKPSGRANNFNLEGYLKIIFIHCVLCSHGKIGCLEHISKSFRVLGAIHLKRARHLTTKLWYL